MVLWPAAIAKSANSAIEMDDGADASAFMHQVEGLVDVLQPHGVGNEGVQRDLTLLRLFDIAGQFTTTFHASKG